METPELDARSGWLTTTTITGEAPKNPVTPNEQAAALAGTAEKKIGSYKTFNGTLPDTRGSGIKLGDVRADS